MPNHVPHILVVDDEEGMRLGLTKILEKEGYKITTAANGEKALGLLERLDFNLVITDLKMPKLSGLELLKAMKKSNHRTPLVIITAYASLDSAVEAVREEVDDYLVKPFSREELLETVKRVIKKSKRDEQVIRVIGEREHQLKALMKYTKKFFCDESAGELTTDVLDSALEIFSAKAAAIWLANASETELKFVKGIHVFGLPSEKKPIKFGEGFTGRAAATKEVLVEEDLVRKADEEHKKIVTNFKIKSLISVPLLDGSAVIGVLNVYLQEKRPVSPDELDLFIKWGEAVAIVVSHKLVKA